MLSQKKQMDSDDILNKFPYPYDNQTSEEKSLQRLQEIEKKQAEKTKGKEKTKAAAKKVQFDDEYAIPKYSMIHRSDVDMQDYVDSPNVRTHTRPKALVIDISLPLLSSAAPIQLDIFEKQLMLVSDKPAKYKLAIDLPYPVDENQGSAKFDKAHRKLRVTLPVVPSPDPGRHIVDDMTKSVTNDGTKDVPYSDSCDTNETVSDEFGGNIGKPLIEVISSQDVEGSSEMGTDAVTEEILSKAEVTGSRRNSDPRDVQSLETSLFDSLHADYVLPEFACEQDSSSVTFKFDINRVKHVNTCLLHTSSHSCQLKMVSVGDGGYPIFYKFCVEFDDDCIVVNDGWSVSSLGNIVKLLVVKGETSRGIWNTYKVGPGPDCLEVSD
jgi:dynein assembly factor 2